ncbi:MAG: ABC transporter ATP-binding protein [Kiritimatiellia bacterium]
MNESESFLKDDLPAPVASLLRGRFGDTGELRVALRGDMLEDGSFGETWLVADNSRLGVVNVPTHGKPAFAAEHELENIEELSLVPGVSSAVLEARKGGVRQRILRISNTREKDFAQAVRALNTRIRERKWKPETAERKQKRCLRCGWPLPDSMSVCPRCLDKKMMIRKVLAFLGPYKRLVAALFVFMVTGTLAGLVNPYIGKVLVDDVLKPMQNAHLLPILAGVMVLMYAIQTGIEVFTGRTSARIGTSAICDVRSSVFHRLQDLSLSFYSGHPTGGLITRVNQDTAQLQKLLVDFVPYGVSSIFMAVGILILLLALSWFLTLFVLLPIVGMSLFVWKVFPRFRVYWERYFEKRSRLASYVENVINGVRVVKAFGQEKAETVRFDGRSAEYRDAALAAEYRLAVTMPFLHMMAMLGTPIVWLVGGMLAFRGSMTLGTIIAYTGYVAMLFRPVFTITRLAQIIPDTLAAAGRVFDIIDSRPEIADVPDAVAVPRLRGEITLEDVTFGYESNKPVIHNLSAHIAPKEMIGLVGHSGAGKSTVINLICRLFDVDSGRITIDGLDIRKIKYGDLRRRIGIVMQETFLMDGTIAENIAYGRPGAGIKEIIESAKAANAHEFIIGKVDGYDTEITQGGKNLSAGEKQRLAIARAILCDPAILILDEATASVDLETEKQIQDAIAKMIEERTTIAIAHRLSTLRNADRLMVLEKGKLAEQGTHEELLRKTDGVYRRLVNLHKDTSGLRAVDG